MSAFEFAQAQHDKPSRDWSGYCLVFVHDAFGVGAKYPSAASAWDHAQFKHPETDPNKIPRGVPVFWTGGSHGYGHVAVGRGGDSCWTTDLIRQGKVDVARISDVHARWGLTLVGWAEDINGVRVYTPPKPAPKPKWPGVDAQAATNIENGTAPGQVRRPRVRARLRQIIARLRHGKEA